MQMQWYDRLVDWLRDSGLSVFAIRYVYSGVILTTLMAWYYPDVVLNTRSVLGDTLSLLLIPFVGAQAYLLFHNTFGTRWYFMMGLKPKAEYLKGIGIQEDDCMNALRIIRHKLLEPDDQKLLTRQHTESAMLELGGTFMSLFAISSIVSALLNPEAPTLIFLANRAVVIALGFFSVRAGIAFDRELSRQVVMLLRALEKKDYNGCSFVEELGKYIELDSASTEASQP